MLWRKDSAMLRTLVALVLIMHGLAHAMGFLESWTRINVGFRDAPWVLGGATVESAVGKAFGLLWLVAMAGWVGAGLGLLLHQEWWVPLAIASAVVSLVTILPWWNTVVDGARFGGTLVDAGMLALLLLPWYEQFQRALQ
jgi:hypothetical protein